MDTYVVDTRLQDEGWEKDLEFLSLEDAYHRICVLVDGPLGESSMYRIRCKEDGCCWEIRLPLLGFHADLARAALDDRVSKSKPDFSPYDRMVLDLAVKEPSEPSMSWLNRHGFAKVVDENGGFTDEWPQAMAAWRLACARALVEGYGKEDAPEPGK
jgi:hypothetical protein